MKSSASSYAFEKLAGSWDLCDDYKIELKAWKYVVDQYEKYHNQSIGLFGFIMKHLDTLAETAFMKGFFTQGFKD